MVLAREGWGMIHERLVFAQTHKKGKEPERNNTYTHTVGG